MESIKVRLVHYPMAQLDAVVLLELLECFKFLMKDEYGMRAVIDTEGAVGTIAMCLDFKWDRVCLAVMEILSVTCFSSEEGHRMVLESLDRLFRRRMEKVRRNEERSDDCVLLLKKITNNLLLVASLLAISRFVSLIAALRFAGGGD